MPRKLTEMAEDRERWRRSFGSRVKYVREHELQENQVEFSRALGFRTGAWTSDIELGVNGLDVFDFWRFLQRTAYPAGFFLDPGYTSVEASVPRSLVEWERLFGGDRFRAEMHHNLEKHLLQKVAE